MNPRRPGAAGAGPAMASGGTLRVSVGIEPVEALFADLSAAIAAT